MRPVKKRSSPFPPNSPAVMPEKSTRELVAETARDVKWICRTLARMEEEDACLEQRLRTLEGWRSETVGGGAA